VPAFCDDLRPAALLVTSGHVLGGASAIDAQWAVTRGSRPAQPEAIERYVRIGLRMPCELIPADVSWLENQITCAPCRALAAVQRGGSAVTDAECGEHVRGWQE
jgi:hypothetical protein